jgi:hypothetical protein
MVPSASERPPASEVGSATVRDAGSASSPNPGWTAATSVDGEAHLAEVAHRARGECGAQHRTGDRVVEDQPELPGVHGQRPVPVLNPVVVRAQQGGRPGVRVEAGPERLLADVLGGHGQPAQREGRATLGGVAVPVRRGAAPPLGRRMPRVTGEQRLLGVEVGPRPTGDGPPRASGPVREDRPECVPAGGDLTDELRVVVPGSQRQLGVDQRGEAVQCEVGPPLVGCRGAALLDRAAQTVRTGGRVAGQPHAHHPAGLPQRDDQVTVDDGRPSLRCRELPDDDPDQTVRGEDVGLQTVVDRGHPGRSADPRAGRGHPNSGAR